MEETMNLTLLCPLVHTALSCRYYENDETRIKHPIIRIHVYVYAAPRGIIHIRISVCTYRGIGKRHDGTDSAPFSLPNLHRLLAVPLVSHQKHPLPLLRASIAPLFIHNCTRSIATFATDFADPRSSPLLFVATGRELSSGWEIFNIRLTYANYYR